MRIRLAILILTMMLVTDAMARQNFKEANPDKRAAMVASINKAASEITSISCDFEQTKFLSILDDKMVARGRMFFKQRQNLRWEYLSPYQYVFVVAGDKVLIQSSKGNDEIDVQSSRMFQEIVKIMVNSVTGRCLSTDEEFSISMYESADDKWIAELKPRKKELKQMFDTITLYFDPSISMITKIEMEEKSGDVTRIELKNIHTNINVDEKLFSLD